MKKDGKDLQRLIRAIESALAAGNKSVKVEMPKMLPDKVTGKMREHDVVLTIATGHHHTLVALECRDRSRPVGVPAVEEFSKKCEATGVHSGVMVSSKGYYKTALRKAAFYNIGCFTLEEAEGFDWCLTAGMSVYHRTLTTFDAKLLFPADVRPARETLQDENGTLITKEHVRGWARQVVEHFGAPRPPYGPENMEGPGDYTRSAHDTNPKLFGIVDGEQIRASLLSITVSYTVTEEFRPFSFQTYRDAGKGQNVTQAAVMRLEVGDGKYADVVLSTKEQGLITMSVVPGGQHPKLPEREKKKCAVS